MNQKNSRNGRRQKIILSILSVMIIVFLACGIYLNDYYHADMDAIETFTVEHSVEMRSDAEGNLVFEPEEATAGFVFIRAVRWSTRRIFR